jgi:hypothetical protein
MRTLGSDLEPTPKQQLGDRPRVQRRIALGRAQVSHQQLLAAQQLQRQEAVVAVPAAEVTPLVLLV